MKRSMTYFVLAVAVSAMACGSAVPAARTPRGPTAEAPAPDLGTIYVPGPKGRPHV